VAHAGHRFIQQQHFGLERQGGRDLERPLAAIGQFHRRPMRKGRQADIGDERHGTLVEDVERALRPPEVERRSTLALQRDAHVLEHRQVRKNGGNLERPHQPETRHLGGRQRRDVASLVDDAPPARPHELRQQVEAGGLAGAVGPDQRMNGAARHPQADVVHGDEAGEFLGQVLGFEDEIAAHDIVVPVVTTSVSTPGSRSAKGGHLVGPARRDHHDPCAAPRACANRPAAARCLVLARVAPFLRLPPIPIMAS
jgi:hypothetical protein